MAMILFWMQLLDLTIFSMKILAYVTCQPHESFSFFSSFPAVFFFGGAACSVDL